MSIYKKRRSLKKSPFTLYVFKFLSAILEKCCSYCKCNNIINIIISSLDITVKKITYKSLGMARVDCNKNKWFYEFYKCAHDVLLIWKCPNLFRNINLQIDILEYQYLSNKHHLGMGLFVLVLIVFLLFLLLLFVLPYFLEFPSKKQHHVFS